MTQLLLYRTDIENGIAVASTTVEKAWMNQAILRHCRVGPKSAPPHRDFRPGIEGVS